MQLIVAAITLMVFTKFLHFAKFSHVASFSLHLFSRKNAKFREKVFEMRPKMFAFFRKNFIRWNPYFKSTKVYSLGLISIMALKKPKVWMNQMLINLKLLLCLDEPLAFILLSKWRTLWTDQLIFSYFIISAIMRQFF